MIPQLDLVDDNSRVEYDDCSDVDDVVRERPNVMTMVIIVHSVAYKGIVCLSKSSSLLNRGN